jgi:hypothetical protein
MVLSMFGFCALCTPPLRKHPTMIMMNNAPGFTNNNGQAIVFKNTFFRKESKYNSSRLCCACVCVCVCCTRWRVTRFTNLDITVHGLGDVPGSMELRRRRFLPLVSPKVRTLAARRDPCK